MPQTGSTTTSTGAAGGLAQIAAASGVDVVVAGSTTASAPAPCARSALGAPTGTTRDDPAGAEHPGRADRRLPDGTAGAEREHRLAGLQPGLPGQRTSRPRAPRGRARRPRRRRGSDADRHDVLRRARRSSSAMAAVARRHPGRWWRTTPACRPGPTPTARRRRRPGRPGRRAAAGAPKYDVPEAHSRSSGTTGTAVTRDQGWPSRPPGRRTLATSGGRPGVCITTARTAGPQVAMSG